ncbi:MAG: PxxKW family cysteine-rich protein [Desulfobulbaceae bacterium]|nr:PxxKW family cysteine-rich protein [Desulfobulbaceae bacterium]MCK5322722.1 PxxKW family cysteine-rich protein [Desulfobulbaceae bacterium]MCK5437076.1 PxxKW family cysteine-rich protein [Desulfobulbaceae bacterium]MCK5543619.1 PxxKW family cysteine-rich protein [Desulfobulbaceae bacterium]
MAKAKKKQISEDTLQAAKEKFASGYFKPVVEKCEGCDRTVAFGDATYCGTYAFPDTKWKAGICNFASHVKPEISTSKVKINPLKASKRAMAGRK